MTTPLGTWGNEIFGRGLFGWAQVGCPVSFSVVNIKLLGILVQDPPNVQIISSLVEIGGSAAHDVVERIDISFSENSVTASCNLVIVGDKPAWVAAGSEVEINTAFTLEDGTIYTARLFTGRIKTANPSTGGNNRTTQVTCWDSNEANLSKAVSRETWSGMAQQLVSAELENCGCSDIDVDFADYLISPLPQAVLTFATVRDLIRTVANQKDEARIISDPSGRIMVWSYDKAASSPVTMTASCYTSYQSVESLTDKYKTYSVTGADGVTETATGTGDYDEGENLLYDDANDPGSCAPARAAAVIAKSERSRRVIQVPLNPYLRVGDSFDCETPDGNTETIKITAISHSIQWTGESSPGCWSAISGEVVP